MMNDSLTNSLESSLQNPRGSIDTDANALLENESVIKEAEIDEEEEHNEIGKNKIRLEIHKRESVTNESINITDRD